MIHGLMPTVDEPMHYTLCVLSLNKLEWLYFDLLPSLACFMLSNLSNVYLLHAPWLYPFIIMYFQNNPTKMSFSSSEHPFYLNDWLLYDWILYTEWLNIVSWPVFMPYVYHYTIQVSWLKCFLSSKCNLFPKCSATSTYVRHLKCYILLTLFVIPVVNHSLSGSSWLCEAHKTAHNDLHNVCHNVLDSDHKSHTLQIFTDFYSILQHLSVVI